MFSGIQKNIKQSCILLKFCVTAIIFADLCSYYLVGIQRLISKVVSSSRRANLTNLTLTEFHANCAHCLSRKQLFEKKGLLMQAFIALKVG